MVWMLACNWFCYCKVIFVSNIETTHLLVPLEFEHIMTYVLSQVPDREVKLSKFVWFTVVSTAALKLVKPVNLSPGQTSDIILLMYSGDLLKNIFIVGEINIHIIPGFILL